MQHCFRRGCRWWLGFLLLAGLMWSPAAGFGAITVQLPLKVRYDLLAALVRQSMFTGPGRAMVLEDPADPCRSIRISQPRFNAAAGGRLRLEVRIDAAVGTRIGGGCLTPVQWRGYLALLQRPQLDPQRWRLSFRTEDVVLYDAAHRPLETGGMVGEMVKAQVLAGLAGMSIDLAPPVDEFKAFLLPLFPRAVRRDTLRMLQSMRPGPLRVTPTAIEMDVLADVTEVYEAEKDVVPEPVSKQDLAGLIENWQAWDAFLVSLLNSLPAAQLTDNDRRILLDALLDIRYGFIRELEHGTLKRGFVRRQFIETWNRIAPVFLGHLAGGATGTGAGYLAFFTASDALTVLDRIGPTMGLEISRNGLIRMAQYMRLQNAENLSYESAVDPQLRRVLGMGPLSGGAGPAGPPPDPEKPTGGAAPSGRLDTGSRQTLLGALLPRAAWAGEKPRRPSMAEIRRWLVTPDNMNTLVPRVRRLLEKAAAATRRKPESKSAALPSGFFRRTVLATAWQESCYRQFVVKNRKLTYLQSYNRSSVGLMQINERVWRGIYNLHRLRWDITYNARAGCDILNLYLERYALRKYGKSLAQRRVPQDFVSGLLYALYNGGPSELKKFPGRLHSGKLHRSDRLFREKLGWVRAAAWRNIRRCLGGS